MSTLINSNTESSNLNIDNDVIEPHISSFVTYKTDCFDCNKLIVLELINDEKFIELHQQSMFRINEELEIHSKAFYQLPLSERRTLLLCADNNVDKDIKKSRMDACQPIRQKYKILFISERHSQLLHIVKKFNSIQRSLSDTYSLFIEDILIKLVASKPFEINRVFKLFSNEFRKNDKVINASITFAHFNEITNISDFCAVTEFAFITLESDVKAYRQKYTDKIKAVSERKTYIEQQKQIHDNQEIIEDINQEDQFKQEEEELNIKKKKYNRKANRSNKVILEDLAGKLIDKDEKKKEYKTKLTKCIKELDRPTVKGAKFSSPFTEITHFVKHCYVDFTNLNLKEFEDHLRDQMKGASKQYWTQDGTHKFHYYKFEATPSVYYTLQILEEVSTQKTTIVTLYKDEKELFT